MKKSLRKLTLNRDTVIHLDARSLGDLRHAALGSNSACDSICDMISCNGDCPSLLGRF